MSITLKGNTSGLAASGLKAVQKLGRRRVGDSEIISFELARELFAASRDLQRRIGLLISREGEIEEIVIGSRDILYLPDLGRYRYGKGRLRRLRLVFSDLSNRRGAAHIPFDVYTDLEKLRLDAVVSIKEEQNRVLMSYAHILPNAQGGERPVHTESTEDLARFSLDFRKLMESLEEELSNADAHAGKGGAILVGVYGKDIRDSASRMDELKALADTAGVPVIGTVIQRREPDPRTLIGKGRLEDLMIQCVREDADLLIFDGEMRPSQWRAITNSTELKVIDRSMLILDIFAQRAQSNEGRLQVELAQLRYNLPRLVEKDTGLSRLTGGIGGRGPGETKLEIGRRRIRDRISFLEKKIDELSRQRSMRRLRREERNIPLVSLIGYTNAGKSSLFNALTKSSVFVENKLFATLDPAQRRLVLPYEGAPGTLVHLVLADTVGFIRDLPSDLSNAFRATLEEIRGSALLLHVLEGSDAEIGKRRSSVSGILKEMELDGINVLTLVNKADLLTPGQREDLSAEIPEVIYVSARTREGLGDVRETLERMLLPDGERGEAGLPC